MKNYAFKRASSNPSTGSSLHSKFITEYADTTLFEPGFHKQEDGYEILPEDQFFGELAKNDSLHVEFLKKKAAQDEAIRAALEAEAQVLEQEQRKLEEEFNQFQKWKKKAKR